MNKLYQSASAFLEILMTHTMWSPKLSLLILTLALLHAHTLAEKKSYVVYMGAHEHPAEEEQSLAYVNRVHESHHQLLASFVGSTAKARDAIFYSYEHHINGFAAMLEDDQAAEIAKHPSVVSVFPNKLKKLHTTHSWEFMMLEKDGKPTNGSIWESARFGEDIIIATIDTGVWPESRSFSDEGYGPVPKKWRGTCQNNTKDGVPCNKKLIGASFYHEGYSSIRSIDSNQSSARDLNGHGTHTLSTAGGNFVEGANLFGMCNGTAKGGSPRARVVAYKVCWTDGCSDADILKALDSAIYDGVDVLSMSLGGEASPYFNDSMSIGSFHAVKHGIVVVCSAGNDGPDMGSVENVSPWMITVGASSNDRGPVSFLELKNGLRLKGESITSNPLFPEKRLYPLVNAVSAKASNASDNDALLCKEGSLDPTKVKGKILLCLSGETEMFQKGYAAYLAGAAGFIFRNNAQDKDDSLFDDDTNLPAIHITYTDGLAVLSYINSTDDPLAYITLPNFELGVKPAPKMADFSSTGPNSITPEILKPDITAPGVNILAAYNPQKPIDDSSGRVSPYNLLDGTSMSCPHVSGVAGLLRVLYPHWSPSAIKSAIMTTASVRDNNRGTIQEALSKNPGTPFNYGSGHLRPNRAQDPGLVYDLSTEDYLNFLCAVGYNETLINPFSRDHKCPPSSSNSLLDFNYPSITVPRLSKPVTVTRKLKNVGTPGKYRALVHHPRGVVVKIEPEVLEFKEIGEEKMFKLRLKVKSSRGLTENVFGELVWTDGLHYVRSPIVVSNGPTIIS